MAKTALSSLRSMMKKQKRMHSAGTKRAGGANGRAAFASEEALEDTPGRPIADDSRAARKARAPKQKSGAALAFRRFIVVPIVKIARSIKNDKKLRLRYCAAAVFLVCGIIAAVLLTLGNHAAAGSAHVAGPAIALQSRAPEVTRHAELYQAEVSSGYVREVSTPKPTPVATTPPEPSVTPAPTKKPESTTKPKSTPKPKSTKKPAAKPAKAPSLSKLSEYFMVEADKYYDDIGYSSNYYDYTEDEVLMLARVITREAGNEKYDGMLAVGNVVMNRVLCGHWGKTIESVVTAKNQFAYRPSLTPKQKCVDAARDVLKNQHWVVPQNVYFFNSGRTAGKDWGRYKYCMKIGGHCFYTHKLGKRYNGKGTPPALYKRTFKWPQYGCKPENRVKRLKHMLAKLGYDVSSDAYFGQTTKEAVKKFQKGKKLKADGVAGPATIKALIKAYGTDAYVKKYVK